jgi:hypothetical protein
MSVNLIIENNEPPVALDVLCLDVPGEGTAHAHEGTLARWCRVGLRGIRLESVLCGVRRSSSRAAWAGSMRRLPGRRRARPAVRLQQQALSVRADNEMPRFARLWTS